MAVFHYKIVSKDTIMVSFDIKTNVFHLETRLLYF